MEEIGKIKLNDSRYSGTDVYSDGSVEDEILDIVKKYSAVEYGRVIEERRSWPVLYHLSPLRENIVDWLPIGKDDKVLEVGSGCGAVTGALAAKAGSVTCVELSRKRSLINAHRHRDCDNVTIHVGNFRDIEPDLPSDYDYICLIGVFEYGLSYIGGETPYEDFLRLLKSHLAERGRIVIAIENKYGLKYFAGCKEDHLGTWFSGIENYAEGDGVRTFSRNGLERIFDACGMKNVQFYYPYPDYKFMTALYSDAYLPKKGELSGNLRNLDRDRMLLFDERAAFDGIVEDGLFPVFSNSFVAVLGEKFDIQYVKYSNERAPEYAIRTEIGGLSKRSLSVRKYPLGREAEEHIRSMAAAYENLADRYRGGKLEINRCQLVEDEGQVHIRFEFVPGTPLSELMDRCLERGDQEGFQRYFAEYMERIGYNSQYPAADFDLIFANILVDGDRWTLIDYEWTFGKPMETRELAFRAVYCYLLEDERRNKLNLDAILNELQITEAEAEEFRERERDFQSFVTGKSLVLGQLRELIGTRTVKPQELLEEYWAAEKRKRIQIYEDRGSGYHEEESRLIQPSAAYVDEKTVELELAVDGDVRMLRIDPAFTSCVVRLERLTFNEVPIPLDKKHVSSNGKLARPATIVFPTEDPNINLLLDKLPGNAENRLSVRMEVAVLPLDAAREMAEAVKRRL